RAGEGISLRLSWTSVRAGWPPVSESLGRRSREKTEHRAGHRCVYLLTFAGFRPRDQGAKHADGGVEPAQMVCVGRADRAWIFGIHQYAHHPTQSLPYGVIGRPMDIVTRRASSGDGAAD